MSIKITPVYGFGAGRQVASRRDHTADIFDGPSDEERQSQFRIRCVAAQDFLAGRRPDPDVTAQELSCSSSLGGDAFDCSVDAGGFDRHNNRSDRN